jgi:hypothetical protein
LMSYLNHTWPHFQMASPVQTCFLAKYTDDCGL